MDGKQLKNSILQWAIQGKLVPQNPKDEPAQKLLERIVAARNEYSAVSACHPERSAKGTKSKDLKKKTSKNPPSRIYRENGVWYEQVGTAIPKDISDEIPFEIPENWAWCRLGDLGVYRKGPFGSSLTKSMFVPKSDETIKVYEQKNAIKKDYTLGDYYISQKKFNTMQSFIVRPNDIIVSCAGTIGETYMLPLDAPIGIINQALMRVCLYDLEIADYWQLFFEYILLKKAEMKGAGSAIKNIPPFEILKSLLIALPPVQEQKRLLGRYRELLKHIEEYDDAQEQLDKLNKELPEALKKSILQEAIQGKLVPQNPKDEPAQKLLERIAASRNGDVSPWSGAIGSSKNSKKSLSTSLRGAKATKQSKNPPSRIYRENGVWYEQIGSATPKDITDEIPFEIPETWTWSRLKNIVFNHGQKIPTESFSYIDIGSIDNKRQKLNDKENIIQASAAPSRARKIVKIDDILYSTVRPYLHNMCIIDREFSKEPIASTGFAVLACNECVVVKFLFYYLLSPKFDDYANDGDNAKGIAYPAINDEKLYKALIPIPPLAEQKRIVAKLEQLFKVL